MPRPLTCPPPRAPTASVRRVSCRAVSSSCHVTNRANRVCERPTHTRGRSGTQRKATDIKKQKYGVYGVFWYPIFTTFRIGCYWVPSHVTKRFCLKITIGFHGGVVAREEARHQVYNLIGWHALLFTWIIDRHCGRPGVCAPVSPAQHACVW